jgi:serine/threonine protein kinase
MQAFDCLEKLHRAHHLHRDVKPDNFMISTTDNKVRIIDFGLVINYRPDGEGGDHIKLGMYTFQGTPRFGSINTLKGYNSGRRDDLEGLGYTIMELIDAN